ncbi:hypothetical protein E2C06_00840 [Dankookia rubra]|uniref:Uncharacterized protein n=1 Tax=Dankookia rubra TaxID=1442381 RepID=A0A4R5QN15_9PROT|nr:hypothetical protein [Dankookia rubra]TDH64523.1 hypothetical protein E2C06_00840 [Dankookia rubra]
MNRTAAARAAVSLLPGVVRDGPRDHGSIIARDRQSARSTSGLERTGVMENLRVPDTLTVFVVTDQGIARQPENLAQMPFPIAGGWLGGPRMDPVLAPTVVNAHMVDRRIGSGQLRPGMSLRSRGSI